ncbi:MAG: hypothetical protein J6575_03575 [Bifidobacterium sp.]|nr:hypothetical protein [Bifidobacterium sp.]
MTRQYTTGFWCDSENDWRYINLSQKRVWEKCENNGHRCWRIVERGGQPTRDTAAVMRHEGWGLLSINTMDPGEYERAIDEAGDYPKGMTLGDGRQLTDADKARGWRPDPLNASTPGFYELVPSASFETRTDEGASDEDVCAAAFLGCEPDEVEDVIARYNAIDITDRDRPEPGKAVDSVVPIGKAWREVPELAGLDVKPRVFGRLHHRVAYVFVTANGVTVAWKEGYVKGNDRGAERKLHEYVQANMRKAA